MEGALDFRVGFVEDIENFGDPLWVGGFCAFEGGHGLSLSQVSDARPGGTRLVDEVLYFTLGAGAGLGTGAGEVDLV